MRFNGRIGALFLLSPLLALPACRTTVSEGRFCAFKAYVERMHERISAEADRSSGIADETLRVLRIADLSRLREVLPWAGMLGVMAHAVGDAEPLADAEEAVRGIERAIERFEKETL